MNVTKRDGRVVLFDKEKIKTAVIKAFLDVDGEETAYAKDNNKEINWLNIQARYDLYNEFFYHEKNKEKVG